MHISIHQEDIRLQGVARIKPYMSLGLVIMKQDPHTGTFDLHHDRDFEVKREIQLEIELDKGKYLIVCRTSGCSF